MTLTKGSVEQRLAQYANDSPKHSGARRVPASEPTGSRGGSATKNPLQGAVLADLDVKRPTTAIGIAKTSSRPSSRAGRTPKAGSNGGLAPPVPVAASRTPEEVPMSRLGTPLFNAVYHGTIGVPFMLGDTPSPLSDSRAGTPDLKQGSSKPKVPLPSSRPGTPSMSQQASLASTSQQRSIPSGPKPTHSPVPKAGGNTTARPFTPSQLPPGADAIPRPGTPQALEVRENNSAGAFSNASRSRMGAGAVGNGQVLKLKPTLDDHLINLTLASKGIDAKPEPVHVDGNGKVDVSRGASRGAQAGAPTSRPGTPGRPGTAGGRPGTPGGRPGTAGRAGAANGGGLGGRPMTPAQGKGLVIPTMPVRQRAFDEEKMKRAGHSLAKALQRTAKKQLREIGKQGNQVNMLSLFKILDTDSSGKITKAEFEQAVFDMGALVNLRTVQELFDWLDVDESKSIDRNELARILVSAMQQTEEEDARRFKPEKLLHNIKKSSLYGSEGRDTEEIRADLAKKELLQTQLQSHIAKIKIAIRDSDGARLLNAKGLYSALNYFDVNGDGTVDKDELKQVLDIVNCPLEDSIIESVIEAYDMDGSGKLDREELVSAFFPQHNVYKQIRARSSSAI